MAKITTAQKYTLLRIMNGETAQLNLDAPRIRGRWLELRTNCQSLPRLYSLDLVEPEREISRREIGLYHNVKLTEKGRKLVEGNADEK
ncbi:hypothetical protein ACXMRP_003195 [Yersinia enterocolitica]